VSGRPRILIAEDEPAIARLLEFKLSKEGFEISIARDGGEAIEKARTGKWDLAILDVMMPVKSGWEVLRELRKDPAHKNIPVLILSGKAEDLSSAQTLIGNTYRMQKPFVPDELVETIRGMLDAQRKVRLQGMKALVDEFLDSFSERKAELELRRAELERALATGDSNGARQATLAVHVVVHRLAGTAGTYGLPRLGALAEALDDLLAMELARDPAQGLSHVPGRAAVLSEALTESSRARGDALQTSQSAAAQALLSAAQQLEK
jgi:DNA-binding response OmpR family regulator